MTIHFRTLTLLFSALLALSGAAVAANDYSGALKVGTTAAFAPPLEVAAEEARKQGLKVDIIEFSDWTAPNVSLENGDIDVNLFQHLPFLHNANKEGNFHLVAYARRLSITSGCTPKNTRASPICRRAPKWRSPTT